MVIASIGFLAQLAQGWQAASLSFAIACTLFTLLLLPAMRGMLGGGDVKLAAAVALGLPPAATWDFIFATVMIGGLLGLAYLAGPYLAPRPHAMVSASLLRRVAAVESWRLRRRGPVPYGVAIAGGGILVLLGLPGP
jgi:prepilin peptidase CpaA